MSSLALWLANRVSLLTPHTRLFAVRRRMFAAAGAKIDSRAKINGAVRLHQSNVHIGDSWIGPGCQLYPTSDAAIVIGNGCALSPEVMLHCGSHEIGQSECRAGKGISAPITIGDGTWVGTRAVFLAGATVGRGCVVGAGSVVRGQFENDVLLAGVPARVVRSLV